MIKRISRSLSDVASDVLQELKTVHGVTDEQLEKLRDRVKNSGYRFPYGGIRVKKDILWIDYRVQRDVIIKTILSLLKKWDNRICQPGACYTEPTNVIRIDEDLNIFEFKRLYIYDAQHRSIVLAVLGFDTFRVTVSVEADARFPSYAFRTSNSVVKKIGKPDFHRNNLRLYELNVHDEETIPAYNLQQQFDRLGIDFVEKPELIPADERQKHYMSHFDYAYKPMGSDKSGKTAGQILAAIITAWPKQQKIQNGIYVGMWHMAEVMKSLGKQLPDDWMTGVCLKVAESFSNAEHVEDAADRHAKWLAKSKSWNVPESMYKFMREVYRLNGGTLVIPADGPELELDKGIWVDSNLIPNHKNLYRKPVEIKENQLDIA